MRIQEAKKALLDGAALPAAKALHQSIRMAYSEIARRISCALAPISLTWLGLAFGVSLGRSPKPYQLLFPVSLAATFLICFFAAKALSTRSALACALYLGPQILIILASIWKMERLSSGVES
jgi:lipopolysaccharide export system permease protein